jgi:hypothetical protein
LRGSLSLLTSAATKVKGCKKQGKVIHRVDRGSCSQRAKT